MPLTNQQKIEVRNNSIKRMEYELEDLHVSYDVQKNLGNKEKMEAIEKDMEKLQKSINLIEEQIKELKNPPQKAEE